MELKKATLAAELFLKVDLVKECIDAFISAEEWGKAKKVAEQLDRSLISYVEESYKQSLMKSGDVSGIAEYDAVAGLDLYANKGQWEECLKLAEKQVNQLRFKIMEKNFY